MVRPLGTRRFRLAESNGGIFNYIACTEDMNLQSRITAMYYVNHDQKELLRAV